MLTKKIAGLIDVKSIITIALTATFCGLVLMGKVSQEFMTVYTMIITFYFSSQSQKGERKDE